MDRVSLIGDKMIKEKIDENKNRYTGTILGFNYDIECADDDEFKLWLRPKLEKYMFSDLELSVLKDILGITALEEI